MASNFNSFPHCACLENAYVRIIEWNTTQLVLRTEAAAGAVTKLV